jgi:hypothetical protein
MNQTKPRSAARQAASGAAAVKADVDADADVDRQRRPSLIHGRKVSA